MWIIYNTVYNCQSGVAVLSSSLGPGAASTDVYVIGNVFYDIHDENGSVAADWRGNSYSAEGVCVLSWSQGAWVVGNTFYDYNAGILCPATALTWKISGNIFANRAGTLGTDINVFDPGGANVISNNLFTSLYVQNNESAITSLPFLNNSKGPGNVIGAPAFVNAAASNFALQSGSAGVDAGGSVANAVYALFQQRYGRSIAYDRVGTPRPQNGAWDIGAFEYSTGGTLKPAPAKPVGVGIDRSN
jgi:hypothetical protein